VDEVSVTIGSLLERAARFGGERTAVVAEGGERWSYADLRSRVLAVARGLIALGVGPGDRVGVWMVNSPSWIVVCLATCSIGSVAVPISTAMRAGEVEYIARHSGVRWLITGTPTRHIDLAAEAREVQRRVAPQVEGIVLCDGATADGATADAGITLESLLDWGDQVTSEALDDRVRSVSARQLAFLLYTSGSTGRPKGVMLPQSVMANAIDIGARLKVTGGDCLVLYLPLFHVFGLIGALTLLHRGGKIVLMEKFEARASLQLMDRERATVVYGVTPMYCDQLDHPEFGSFDLSSVRFALVPAAKDLILRVSGRMGVAVNVYGMTETASISAMPHLDDDEERRATTIGPAMPGFEMRVVDPDDRQCAPGDSGELVIRGTSVTPGYWEDEAATAQAFDADGWLRTGDSARQRADGYFEFLGRLKDMLKVGGENVDPAEIEGVLMRHPAVSLAAVVGLEDRRLGEIPIAYVQLKPQANGTTDDIADFVRGHLAHFKLPRQVIVLEQLPLTGSGKVHKPTLVERLRRDAPEAAR
jgi:fatty-acyl-CoA synthase